MQSRTWDGGLAISRDGDARDRMGVMVWLRLSSSVVLKERPHVDAILYTATERVHTQADAVNAN